MNEGLYSTWETWRKEEGMSRLMEGWKEEGM
jgi:hypothetical protein